MATAGFPHPVEPVGTPVDSIAVKVSASYNVWSPTDWQALSKNERFNLIRSKRVVFLSDGLSVPVREALVWLSQNVEEA